MAASKTAPALECWLQSRGAYEALLHVEFLAAWTPWRQKLGEGRGRLGVSALPCPNRVTIKRLGNTGLEIFQ